jgi:large repetitive protein
LPTVPDLPDPDPDPDAPLLIHNNVPASVPGRFGIVPGPGGSARFSDVVTAQGITQLFEDVSFLYDFLNYVDVGINGQAFDLGATMTDDPELTGPNEVTSAGTFAGPNGDIDWAVRTYFVPGFATLYNEVTFTSSDDVRGRPVHQLPGPGHPGAQRRLVVHLGGAGNPQFRSLHVGQRRTGRVQPRRRVRSGHGLGQRDLGRLGGGQIPVVEEHPHRCGDDVQSTGQHQHRALTPFNDPDLGMVHGLADVTTAFAWTLNPGSTTATITTFLNLILEDPTVDSTPQNFAGDWQSIRLEQFAHDRNVESRVGTRVQCGGAGWRQRNAGDRPARGRIGSA